MNQVSIRSCACKLIPNEHTDQDTLRQFKKSIKTLIDQEIWVLIIFYNAK